MTANAQKIVLVAVKKENVPAKTNAIAVINVLAAAKKESHAHVKTNAGTNANANLKNANVKKAAKLNNHQNIKTI